MEGRDYMGNEGKQNMGEYMRCLRKMRGLSMEDVETKTGISRSYICRIENSSRDNLTMDKINKLSECYRIEFSTFEQFCDGAVKKDGREVKDLTYILLNEQYLFGEIEAIEAKISICNVIREMELYCTKEEVKRADSNKLMDLIDTLREDVLSA